MWFYLNRFNWRQHWFGVGLKKILQVKCRNFSSFLITSQLVQWNVFSILMERDSCLPIYTHLVINFLRRPVRISRRRRLVHLKQWPRLFLCSRGQSEERSHLNKWQMDICQDRNDETSNKLKDIFNFLKFPPNLYVIMVKQSKIQIRKIRRRVEIRRQFVSILIF